MLRKPLSRVMPSPASYEAKRPFIAALFIILMLMTTGCSFADSLLSLVKGDGSGQLFKLSIPGDPVTLDPILAEDESSIAVLRNMFEGLLKTAPSGEIVCGSAESYTVSEDGLVYTFYLRRDMEWRAAGGFSEKVTAYDFEFGFSRLLDPELGSSYAKDYSCIKNSLGEGEPCVTALDEYTLEITLSYPNALFPSLLTRLPASPCCKEFFESCNGKYGLEAKSIASNGPFYVRLWQHDRYGSDNYVRLTRNDAYSAASRVYPSGISFLVEKSERSRLESFNSGSTQVYFPSGEGGIFGIPDDSQVYRVYDSSAGLVVSPKNEILSREDVKEALFGCIERESLSEGLPQGTKAAYGIFPPDAYFDSRELRSILPEPEISSDPRLSGYKWSFILTESEKRELAGCNVLVADSFDYIEVLELVIEQWEACLGFTPSIEIVNETDYQRRLEEGSYDICLYEIEKSLELVGYLAPFSSDGELASLPHSAEAGSVYSSRYSYLSLEELLLDCQSAESALVSSGSYCPLLYLSTAYAVSDGVCDLWYDTASASLVFSDAKLF